MLKGRRVGLCLFMHDIVICPTFGCHDIARLTNLWSISRYCLIDMIPKHNEKSHFVHPSTKLQPAWSFFILAVVAILVYEVLYAYFNRRSFGHKNSDQQMCENMTPMLQLASWLTFIAAWFIRYCDVFVHVYRWLISHCLMAVYIDDRYLNSHDSDFVYSVTSDLQMFSDSVKEKTNQ